MAIRPTYYPSEAAAALEHHIQFLAPANGAKSIMVLIAGHLEGGRDLDAVVREAGIPIFGGLFPGVIHNNSVHNSGLVVIDLPFEVELVEGELEGELDALPDLSHFYEDGATAFVFVDSLANGKGSFVSALYNTYGTQFSYIGGGAGSLSFESTPCIISNSGLRTNSFVMAVTRSPISIGVAHGWQPISELMKVTESNDRELISLNWEPAFKVYKSLVEEHSGKSFDHCDFFDLAKSYPFGKPLVQAEYVIRDPMRTDRASVFLVDAIEAGEFVYLMHGDHGKLLEGARRAAETAQQGSRGGDSFSLCIDCISRQLFMGDDFIEELNAVSPDGRATGALTIGELANTGGSYLELYNKTICIARL